MMSSTVPLLLLVLAAAAQVHGGYLSPYPHGLHGLHGPPVVSYGYHTAVVSKPLPLALPLHHAHAPLPLHYPVLPPPVIIKPIATSYQSFHKIDRPALYPVHYVKPLPLHPLPLPLHYGYGHHYLH